MTCLKDVMAWWLAGSWVGFVGFGVVRSLTVYREILPTALSLDALAAAAVGAVYFAVWRVMK